MKVNKSSSFKFFFILLVLLILSVGFYIWVKSETVFHFTNIKKNYWQVRSIDTMKYSRDLAREKLTDDTFDAVIDIQVENIKKTGATHIAIDTPYDQEFLPFLKKWVLSARKKDLNVWFRGNFSGWEEWFEYKPINREEHTKKTVEFILNNKGLFVNGDIFSSCPECENGGPGDPRENGDIKAYRNFLTSEYHAVKKSFSEIGRKVQANYYSMNGDVAKLIMDKNTTKNLDGLVVIDHYVFSPEKLAADITEIAELSGGDVILGEFGAPIPDIHGKMTDKQQAEYLKKAFSYLIKEKKLLGMNYWTSVGSSTSLWNNDLTPKEGVEVIKKYYASTIINGYILDDIGFPIGLADIQTSSNITISDKSGYFITAIAPDENELIINAKGYNSVKIPINKKQNNLKITLNKMNPSPWYLFLSYLHKYFN